MINITQKWLTKPKKVFFNTQIVTTRCPQKFFRGRKLFNWDRLTPEIWIIPADGFTFEDSSPGYDPIYILLSHFD
jgi:hypothetical protein